MATTTATPARLRGNIAVSQATADANPDSVLGYIVWFSVPDEDIRLSRLKREWLVAGLDATPLPRDQKAVNAFKRAVRSLEGITRNEQDKTITQTDVRELVENAKEVHYQVSRVVRDLKGMVVNYPKAVRIWFKKEDDTTEFKPLGDVDFSEVQTIMDGFHAAFDSASKTVTGAKVRTLVRQYLRNDRDEQDNLVGLSAENLRGKAGGVYFVLAKHSDELDRLSAMLWTLYKPEGRAYLYKVPLADGSTERELIRRHYVMNALDDSREVVTDVAELLRGGRQREVRSNVVKFQWRRLERARARAAEYAAALGEEQAEVNNALDNMQKQLRKLVQL